MYSNNVDYKLIDAYKSNSPNSPGSEPMALGSPVSSPNNNVNFLPPYLIRDVPSHSSSFVQNSGVGWSTPIKQPKTIPSAQLSPVLTRKTLYNSPASGSLIGSPSVTKANGPPVESLSDTVSSPRWTGPTGTEFSMCESGSPAVFSPSNILNPNNSLAGDTSSHMSPAQIDPFYTQGETLTSGSQLDETWVTVFGFLPASALFILQQFAQYGKIIDHKLATSGNWIHIKYQSKLQAKKAISKSGKIYGENIMVGVKPCIDMSIMNETGKENVSMDSSANLCQESYNADSFDSSKLSLKNIRPLTQIYKTPNSEAETTPKGKVQPKVNGLLSKVMDCVLKW